MFCKCSIFILYIMTEFSAFGCHLCKYSFIAWVSLFSYMSLHTLHCCLYLNFFPRVSTFCVIEAWSFSSFKKKTNNCLLQCSFFVKKKNLFSDICSPQSLQGSISLPLCCIIFVEYPWCFSDLLVEREREIDLPEFWQEYGMFLPPFPVHLSADSLLLSD